METITYTTESPVVDNTYNFSEECLEIVPRSLNFDNISKTPITVGKKEKRTEKRKKKKKAEPDTHFVNKPMLFSLIESDKEAEKKAEKNVGNKREEKRLIEVVKPSVRQCNWVCRSILLGYQCRAGAKCWYAHTKEELIIENCKTENCQHLQTCQFKHAHETNKEYLVRIGIK